MKIVASIVTCLLAASMVFGDDITDAMDEARSAYESGDYSTAASQLDYASALVRQIKAEGVTAIFCDPLEGWTADDASSSSAGGMMMGGGVSANRTYRKDNSRVTINLVMDSPMLASIAGMISNPAMITMTGGKLIKVQGINAMYKEEGSRMTITFIVNGNAMITIEGRNVTREDVEAYGDCLDLEAL